MRNRIAPLLIVVVACANLRADPIRYDQIPSDAKSYVHFDIERFMACRAVRDMGAPPDMAAKAAEKLGGKVGSATAYFFEDDGVRIVFLVHADAAVCAKGEAYANNAKDKLIIKYDDQQVYYSSEGLLAPLQLMAQGGSADSQGPTKASRGLFGIHGTFSLGTGDGAKPGDVDVLARGPSYKAFVGQDLMVATTDLPTMARALDVLHGRRPSLAKQDPHGLKGDIPDGAIFVGAGLTAHVSGDNANQNANSTTRPANVANAGNFGLDMFASFKGKAQLARFALGEDATSDYIDASITMTDGAVAEQLKNLMIGIKALVSLSQTKQAPLIEPLQIRATGNEVGLHWSWPTAKLSELVRLAQNDDNGNVSTTGPNSDGR